MERASRPCIRIGVLAVALCGPLCAADWPMYRRDARRSGATEERLAFPLAETWVHRPPLGPRPAWPPPARNDFWHEHRGLQAETTYDRAFHVAVAAGAVFYGSSADDAIRSLDAATGRVRWTFFTEGPVRLAPCVAAGRVYAGSDDGCAYALDARDGRLIWRRRIAPEDRRIPGNGRLISIWPVRTGILVDVDAGLAFCGAGLFPNEGVHVCALDASTGEIRWRRDAGSVSPQGYILATATHLFFPTGRTSPAAFARADGAFAGALEGAGGSFAIIADDVLASGPGRTTGSVEVVDIATRESIIAFEGLHLAARGGTAYILGKESISAVDRTRQLALARERNAVAKEKESLKKRLDAAKGRGRLDEMAALARPIADADAKIAARNREIAACVRWKRQSRWPYALILTGDALLAGGDGEVAALRAADGADLWTAPVDGRAYGLAVAAGRLFVSTDTGAIHCFGPGEDAP
ncbi:MAG: PQQ-binding-like beta-propeller repeat protein [Planctomycetes bacterium]|nr:PQQ-binding-like beta-propeller repeat protein [Planctomycetota bacterium]